MSSSVGIVIPNIWKNKNMFHTANQNNISGIILTLLGMIISGWWLTYPSEKNMSSSVGMMKLPIYGKIKMFQTANQNNTSGMILTLLGMIISDWWLTYPSEKSEFVSWDYYSQHMEKMCQTANQKTTSSIILTLLGIIISGWRLAYPSEKYEIWVRQLGLLFPIFGKIKMFQTNNQDNTSDIILTLLGMIISGWWLTYPSEKIWVRQLGWWNSQYMEK